MNNKRDEAVKHAGRILKRLDVFSWNEPATSRQRELEATIAALETILSEAKQTLSSIELVCAAILPRLKKARPAKEKHGRRKEDFLLRNQVIVEAVAAVHQQYGYPPYGNPGSPSKDQVTAFSIVAEALRRRGINTGVQGVRKVWGESRKKSRK